MNLSTTYLGLKLRTPLVPSASPLSGDLANIKRMEDAGASAVVLYSLFEEQLRTDRLELNQTLEQGTFSSPESLTYFPEPDDYKLGPEEYLKHISAAKAAVNIPIIASLNGSSAGGWTSYAHQIEQAGADALELNIFFVPADLDVPGQELELKYLEIVRAVKAAVNIPIAVKLSPFFSNLSNMAKQLDEAGANGLVLFNRFYRPDIELETLEVNPNMLLSTPLSTRLPLRWIAILFNRVRASLAATGGVHRATDALKMLMGGADVTMLCSVLMRHGIRHISFIEHDLVTWMEQHEYESIEQLKGSMSQKNCKDPGAFERAQYLKAISGYTLPAGV